MAINQQISQNMFYTARYVASKLKAHGLLSILQ